MEELNADDLQNIFVFMNRVPTTGLTEAKLLLTVAGKVQLLRNSMIEEENDKDVTGTD